jgi:hypothetical protein
MENNSQIWIKQVKYDLLDNFKKNAIKTSRKIDQIQQEVIEDFGAVDSGFMQLKTFTKFQVNLSSDIIAEASFRTREADYARFVIDGTGTNSKYGPRNYLTEARQQVADYLTTDSYTKTFKKGSPNKKAKKIGKRKF